MDTVSVRELRNRGGQVLQRVAEGETLTVTMDGQPIAELRPVAGRALSGVSSTPARSFCCLGSPIRTCCRWSR